jgi:hypothetical protein
MDTSTSMPNITRLSAIETVPDRPFTNPAHSRADAAILNYMRWRLHYLLSQSQIGPEHPLARELYIQTLNEERGRFHRLVILEREPLLTEAELTLVGFFGHRRGEVNPALLQDVDVELVQEFLNHPYVLSYCSLELADSNWANMVLLRNAAGIEHWRASQKHAYAAREMAPLYYTGIRLHNGVLPSGLASPHMNLLSTKYYDFRGPELWRAIREEGRVL